MNITLHLTPDCNMRCKYCYSPPRLGAQMSFETARLAIDMAADLSDAYAGVIFFGGEPLLCKDLIADIIDYARMIERKRGLRFHFKATTNGLLLDDKFINLALAEDIFIALSIDGNQEAHDQNRVLVSGQGSFTFINDRVDLLLDARPYSLALMVVIPDTVAAYCASVEFLLSKGFRYIICSLDYTGSWEESHMKTLRYQYRELAKLYEAKIKDHKKFYLSPFEVKLASHIKWTDGFQDRCELGRRQLSIAPDGTIFPCVQFTRDPGFAIGHVDDGLDENKRDSLYEQSCQDKQPCSQCAIVNRCNNRCGCLNWQATSDINKVSPVLCTHERILLPIADALGARLFKKKDPLFIQKHYNSAYPFLSLVEDEEEELKDNQMA